MPIRLPTSRARLLLAAAACTSWLTLIASAQQGTSPAASADGRIVVSATRVSLHRRTPPRAQLGGFTFMGGLELTSTQTESLHGLSDLDVSDSGHLTAVSDLGGLFEATLVLDIEGRLIGLADTRLTRLVGEDGGPLLRKSDADAEGLAILPNGDRLVSFEGASRILLYPAGGGRPRRAPMPSGHFQNNGGMEALAADPDRGADAYVVGHETTGETWFCRVSAPDCEKGPTVPKTVFFGLVALRRLPDNRTAYLLRAVDQQRRNRIILRILRGLTEVAKLDLSPPALTDNFEGLATVRRGDSIRFYMISDDNAAAHQRTLLFAFDWRPR